MRNPIVAANVSGESIITCPCGLFANKDRTVLVKISTVTFCDPILSATLAVVEKEVKAPAIPTKSVTIRPAIGPDKP